MSENDIVRVKFNPDIPGIGTTDWAQVDALTEKELTRASLNDPDAPPLTAVEVKRFLPVPDVQSIRERLHLSQRQFADKYHVPVRTLQEWEQKRSVPDSTAIAFLTAIANDPEAISRALNKE